MEKTKTAKGTYFCKMEPFNICYIVDRHGKVQPLGNRRPVRILRVYKR